jgi:hypothetical protein
VAEGRVRGLSIPSERPENRVQDVFHVVENIIVGNTQHSRTARFQLSLSCPVRLVPVVMTAPVDLEHQAGGVAEKVDDVWADW